MKTISIDLETYSDRDLKKCGVYKYAESPNFEILLFGYSVDESDAISVDIANGEEIPRDILNALVDDDVIKWAFNATFERVCLSYWLKKHYPEIFVSYGDANDTTHNYLNPSSWRCSLVWSAYIGLPLSLKGAGEVLKLDDQKMDEGAPLIRYFCVPCKGTKTNNYRTRNLPEHDPEKWTVFKAYNKRDVEVEMAIKNKLRHHPVPDSVWDEYRISEIINDRGIEVDMDVVENAIKMDAMIKEKLIARSIELTGLENPNSVTQMMEWLTSKGIEIESLDKKAVADILATDIPDDVREVLQHRQQLSKSSIKKYQAMELARCNDGRCRGMFFFYGAHSGRWSGRLIQLQNLYKNKMPDLAAARELVRCGDYEMLELLYDNVSNVLSELIRTSFVPKKGYKYIVADFSAIEARVLSFIAGEQWRIDTFAEGKDIYCESASQMFGIPVTKKDKAYRARGKVAELALGYAGGVHAMENMGALDMGLSEDELKPIVDAWRAANPNIVSLWYAVELAAMNAIKQRTTTSTHGLKFTYKSGMLFITLPSGRKLSYVKPKIGVNRFGSESITYMGVGAQKHYERLETYSGKLVENIIQAESRDVLCYAMNTLQDLHIVAHVHDELIIECPLNSSVDEICEKMGRTPDWIPGLLLRADGYECNFYMKD